MKDSTLTLCLHCQGRKLIINAERVFVTCPKCSGLGKVTQIEEVSK